MKAPSCKFPRNARFVDVSINANPVKLTLAPGQTLRQHRASHDDEGHSWYVIEWSHEGNLITRLQASGGRDCDGVHRRIFVEAAPLNRLSAYPIYGYPDRRPDWHSFNEEIYDQYAQLANY